MISFLYRFAISILGLAPMSFAVFVAGQKEYEFVQTIALPKILIGFSVAFCICFVACFILNILLNKIRHTSTSHHIVKAKIETVAQQPSTLLPYFLSYVMPLFLGESIEMEFWLFCLMAIAIASLFTTGISNNPLISVLGYRFYVIQMKSGVSQIYISRERPQTIINGFYAVIYDDNTLIQGINNEHSFWCFKNGRW